MPDRRGPRSLGMVHAAGLSWPLSEDMTDAVFEAKLFVCRCWHEAVSISPGSGLSNNPMRDPM